MTQKPAPQFMKESSPVLVCIVFIIGVDCEKAPQALTF